MDRWNPQASLGAVLAITLADRALRRVLQEACAMGSDRPANPCEPKKVPVRPGTCRTRSTFTSKPRESMEVSMANATVHPDHQLISSEDVEGKNVYGTDSRKIGEIDHLLIDKASGRVAYAVI